MISERRMETRRDNYIILFYLYFVNKTFHIIYTYNWSLTKALHWKV